MSADDVNVVMVSNWEVKFYIVNTLIRSSMIVDVVSTKSIQ